MIVSHIVAVSKNYVIGIHNHLPWKMPHDTAYFHRITSGHFVIMGRKNYEANGCALPDRTNIVITRQTDFRTSDSIVVDSIEKAIELAAESGEMEAFIVGGGEIYKQTLSIVDRIYITVIDLITDGDTYYPEINFSDWFINSEIAMKKDEKNPYDFTYYILERK